jgi:putative DNA primase/helicase
MSNYQEPSLQASSKHIRQLLIGRPLPLPTNGQPVLSPSVSILSVAYAADGPDAARRLWQTTLRYQDPELTAAVEGRLARAGDPAEIKCTDYGNAERLVLRYGHELRYCYPWKTWLVWDGKRWQRDSTGEIFIRAKATVQGIYAEAADTHDQERRELLGKWALKSEADTRIKAMIHQAESEPGIPILPEDLDADRWLLNCLNGTLDLRTGKPRPHRPADLLTKLAPVNYDPEARSELWEQFLARILPDVEVRNYVQRAAGYSLTAEGTEEVLFFPYGPTQSGKSTLLRALRMAMGDYATTADFETWMRRDRVTGAPRNDIAEIADKRLVISLEVEQGKQLAEGLLKWLFGGDPVKARFLYQEQFEFLPPFKLWLAANHRPLLSADDDALWRRVQQIPFDQQIPESERDPTVKARLSNPQESGAAILAWAVQGCLDWQKQGLKPPQRVKDTTREYREEMDPMGDFLEDCCVRDPLGRVANAAIWQTYQDWSRKNRDRPAMGRKQFSQQLEKRGFDEHKSGSRRFWSGLKLIDGEHLFDET